MGDSPLNLINSEFFRKKLITRNLTPYAKAPNRPSFQNNQEYIQSDSSVQDSPDQLIDEPSFANKLYPLNQWGAEGGYQEVPFVGNLYNTKSNDGEYGPGQQDAHILDQAGPESKNWKKINAYSNGSEQLLDAGEFITQPDAIISSVLSLYNNQPYPTTFNPSSYSPVSILLTPDPVGSDGLLSSDSYIARLGAETLRKSFQERIATGIIQQTVGRANLFNVDSGTDILNLVTTRVPLIEPNWTITVPSNPILAATDFALRLAGSIIPTSTIPGSYWDTSINSGQPTTIQQLQNAFRKSAVGNFFNRLLGGDKTGSQLFLNNTGGGQKSRLFGNLKYNRYKPNYDRTFFDRLGGALVGGVENNSNFYVGSKTSDPSRVFSPAKDIPVNEFGQEIQAPVYGPQELAQLYEGPSREIKLGANAVGYINGGGIEGGLTWVSPKYRGDAGKKVGIGGLVTQLDQDFKPSSFNSTESTSLTLKEGSILDDTQRLIDSQPGGGRRLQHVGNAIDQVSKVFNDGYKELTKGSRVLTYVGSIGNEVGSEYCRVFAKDIPYLQYNDLQKQDGIVNENRRFSYSVLDKTYNLNITPNKQEGGQDSSNLIGNANQSYAKKYMFSLENLAWRTSHTPGINVNELPICERGPNGGRIMWFPPYGLTFNENVQANWKGQDFLGRTEPVYTYTNTNRTGTIQWKIVVDHPSVLNVIVNKVLNNESSKERVNGILESFFAGCRKYDLYELAKKYFTISPNELADLQQAIASKDLSKEQLGAAKNTIATGNKTTGGESQVVSQSTQNTPQQTLKQFENYSLYFGNAQPATSTSTYDSDYTAYLSQKSSLYAGTGETFFNSIITPNYNHINNDLIQSLANTLKDNPNSNITIYLEGSASSAGKTKYNLSLSERRLTSVTNYFSQNASLKSYVEQGRLKFQIKALGENAQVQQFVLATNTFVPNPTTYSCTDNDDNNTTPANNSTTSSSAMACRRVTIKSIVVSSPEQNQQPAKPNLQTGSGQGGVNQDQPLGQSQIETKFRKTDNITKRIVRALISECDYFETIKETTPMLYDNLKDKLKFFQPAFHSTTPEGLNSRLTFLQQCMRPGDTIPTSKPKEGGGFDLEFNNAVNTAFGVPPVLILRVGDFYNTKIIPTSLSLTYESLDINPEGIGIQPMIANVTMNFNFVGGSGLKEAVDKLQNALTFNYYANTEIWDDRADVTDDSLKILDKEFLQLVAQASPPTTNQVQNLNGLSNGTTIGTKSNSVISATGETGNLAYQQFMDSFVSQTQTYFQNVFNQSKNMFSQYNNAMLQQWSIERIYQEGNFLVDPSKLVYLIGKPDNLQKNIDNVFKGLLADIDDSNTLTQDPYINWINQETMDLSKKARRQLKDNYISYIKGKKNTYLNAATKIVQDLTYTEQNYIQYLSRINTVPFSGVSWDGTDGFQESNGNVVIYNLTGTTAVGPTNPGGTVPANTAEELVMDISVVQKNIIEFYNVTKEAVRFNYNGVNYTGYLINGVGPAPTSTSITTEVFIPFSYNSNFGKKSFRRQYMLLSNELKSENYQTFKNAMIGNLVSNPGLAGGGTLRFGDIFDAYWLSIAKVAFEEEANITKSFLDEVEKNKVKNFINYTPFPSKKREFKFAKTETPTSEQAKLIKSLGAKQNQNTNKQTWNTNSGGSTYISKVKLN